MQRNQSKRALVEQSCIAWEGDLKAFLVSVLRSFHLAEEACQRTIVRALEAAETVSESTIRGWLFQIALNEARQIRRDTAARQGRLPQLAELVRAASRDELVESGLVKDEVITAVAAAIRRLPHGQGDVVRLRLMEGVAFAKIAELLDRPLGTVLTWMRRGLERLRNDAQLRSTLQITTTDGMTGCTAEEQINDD